jgi:hypothetical protein
MTPQIFQLLAMVPEEQHDAFVHRLSRPAIEAIARETDEIDNATLRQIAEAVWTCLESAYQ